MSLRIEFTKAIREFGVNEDSINTWPNALIAVYNEPQRYYHSVAHIFSMTQLSNKYRHQISNSIVVQLAIFFHDWVYDPEEHDNELRSIRVSKSFAAEVKLENSMTEKVSHYIEATIKHSLNAEDESDEDLKLFLDFDLEVLGRSREKYELYAGQIRQEYGHFSDIDYAKGRVGVLERFLAREKLYFSNALGAELEARARENLGAEIAGLKAGLAA
jgi:predicted metal-dependent HD superfamily phosphohydrolase